MKIQISTLTASLVFGLIIVMFILWSASLLVLLERQNVHNSEAFTNSWRHQLNQLQQKQQLWLQSQYYMLNTLAESSSEQRKFHSIVLEYYKRNPDIWAVNLVFFDDQGLPASLTSKPGCLQPAQMRKSDFGDLLVPTVSSCRIDDKALLEIAGPVSIEGRDAVLLISMDYFSFLREFSSLSYRRLQRSPDSADGFLFREYGPANGRAIPISISVGDVSGVSAQVQLSLQPLTFWDLYKSQAAWVITVLLAGGLLVVGVLYFSLVGPLQELAEKMRLAANAQLDTQGQRASPVGPGLKVMREAFNTLQKMAKRDSLTGLNNRVIFEDRLVQAVREGKRSARRYALVLVEVRGLDAIAQQQGQYIADGLLRMVAANLRMRLRESDNLARFERNLFAILLEVAERDQLESLVEKIYLSVTRRYQVHGRDFDVNAMIGVAIYPDHALTAGDLYQNASDALIMAENSEWPIKFFHERDDADTSGFSMIQALRRAIDRDELKLLYQPVVDLRSYETVYFEALLRWKDPGDHEHPIERTILLAERNHLIKPLTNWIIEAACRFIQDCGNPDLVIGVNLSMIDLHDRQLPHRIEGFLQRYHVRPGQIVIEITEGQIMQDPGEVVDVLANLGVMGLSLSIDDFGTGQASLTYLKELPVEKLKIDQSFVREIVTNPDDQLIVKATIELAHTLDLKVVAEGVETLAVTELLVEMNCDHAQGFYISRPIEAEQVTDWLAGSVKPDLMRKGS